MQNFVHRKKESTTLKHHLDKEKLQLYLKYLLQPYNLHKWFTNN